MGRTKKKITIRKEFDTMEKKKAAGRIPTAKPGKSHGNRNKDYNRKEEKQVDRDE